MVLATERSEASIKEALEDRRTVAWFKNNLIGNERELIPLLYRCLEAGEVNYIENTSVAQAEIINHSDASLVLKNTSEFTYQRNSSLVEIPPQSSTTLEVKTKVVLDSFELSFEVLNAISAPGRHPEITIEFKVNE